MGMVLGLVAIEDENIAKVLADPPLIWKVVAPEDPDMYEAERGEQNVSWFSKLFGKKSEATRDTADIGQPVEETELDKSWHGIHYLLTKTAWEGEPPLNFIILGGQEVGEIDVGYGTARAFRSDAVQEINSALGEITNETLRERFDPGDMMKLEIYPEIWDRDPNDDDTFGYCAEYFDDLKGFVGRTADRHLGMIIYIS